MSYEKEGVMMRAEWLVTDEPEEHPADRQAAYGELEKEDALVREERPIVRNQALSAMDDDDDFWEIPTRLAP